MSCVAVFQAFPIIFIEKRGFTIAQDGLIFIGVGIGTTMGSLINVFTTSHYPALIQKWKGFPPPEQRLFGAMIGGPCFVVGIFWLGWSGEYPGVPWYVPALSTIFVGVAISLVFISFLVSLIQKWAPRGIADSFVFLAELPGRHVFVSTLALFMGALAHASFAGCTARRRLRPTPWYAPP